MKVAITGSAGFLGQGIVNKLQENHDLRLVDRHHPDGQPGETRVLDVCSLEDCRETVAGMDALVIAHMAPREPDSYRDPVLPMDINVKGSANLFHAALEAGVSRICLISSAGVMKGYPEGTYYERDMPKRGRDMYSLSKLLQENVAEHYHRMHGIPVGILRPSGIVDAALRISKYGSNIPPKIAHLIDRNDIGALVDRVLQLPDLVWEVFYTFGHSSADKMCDAAYTRERLQWEPQFGDEALAALYT